MRSGGLTPSSEPRASIPSGGKTPRSNAIALWVIAGLVALGIVMLVAFNNYDSRQREICNDTNTVIQNGKYAGIDTELQPRDC